MSTQNIELLVNQNRLLTEEIQRRVNQLAAINTVAASVSQTLDLNLALQTALDAVLNIVSVEAAGISLIDHETHELVLRAQRGWREDFLAQGMRIKLGEGLSGRAVAEDRVVITGELTLADDLAVPAFLRENIKSQALVPMHAHGQVIGVLSVMSHQRYEFSAEEVDVLKAIADQVGVALDNARLYERTHRQEQHLEAIIYSTADAIIVIDRKGRVDLMNPAARKLFKVKRAEVIGQPVEAVPLPEPLREALALAMQTGGEKATLCEITMRTGKTYAAAISRVHAPSQLDDHESEEGWVLVLQDITALKEAETSRVEFAQAAAHDLRNPLGVALSSITLLQDVLAPLGKDDAETLEIAIAALYRMNDLLDDLLELEQIESRSRFSPQPTDLAQLLEDACREMAFVMQSRGQTFETRIPSSLPEMALDRDWINRAVGNYLSNASKYTHPGGHIVLAVERYDSEVHIEVRDNGPGIPPEAQGRLFERFYRAPSALPGASTPPGTGLGLAIVKSVAETHGGRVYARSTPGQGSTFGVVLPLEPRGG